MTDHLFGRSRLYSFPFWLIVDASWPPEVAETIFGGTKYRIYPPFRSAPANFVWMPEVAPHAIPFLPGTKPQMPQNLRLLTTASVPNLGTKPEILVCWAPEWNENNRPGNFPMDSLRLDWYGEQGSEAEPFLLSFLEQLRWLSGQWWIGRSVDGILGYVRNEFGILANGQPIERPLGTVRAHSPTGDEKPITNGLWLRSIENIQNAQLPLSYEILLLDARYTLAIGDLRMTIINAATACEQAIDYHFERIWNAVKKGEKYRKGKICKGYDISKHVSSDISALIERAFSSDHPRDYEFITHLWDARGNVAHGKAAEFRRNGNVHSVNQGSAQTMLRAAHQLVSWLTTLP